MACSARIPVYAMVTALLFPHSPLKAALVFTAAYATGVIAALGMAWIFRKTILPGESKPLMIELPPYRVPALRTALLHTFDRAKIFVKQAGTIILADLAGACGRCHIIPSPAAGRRRGDDGAGRAISKIRRHQPGGATARHRRPADRANSLQNSYAGKIGHVIEPVIAPLGYDWQIGIGIVSSFAAREVIVSTLAIVYGVGKDAADNNQNSLYSTLRQAKRTDGTPIFNTATCASLLVFYILAAQCLSTTAVVRRETNSWKWPLFQIAYMTGLAYVAALIVYQVLRHFGHA
jgi:ferrous iron transport protein B